MNNPKAAELGQAAARRQASKRVGKASSPRPIAIS